MGHDASRQVQGQDSSSNSSSSFTELTKLYDDGKIALNEQKDLKKAIKLFTKAAEAYNSNIDRIDDLAVVYCARSAAYFHSKKYTESLKDAEESIRLQPEWPKGYFRKAETLAAQEQSQEAISIYKKALELEVDYRSIDILEMRILRLVDEQTRLQDQKLLFKQLIPGRHLCLGTFNPVKKLIFEFGRGMQNLIYLIGDHESKECMVIDPCWDVDGIISIIKKEKLIPTGCIVTHNHFDHIGGKPPAPFRSFGIQVQGVKFLLEKYPEISVYINTNDADVFQNDTGIDPIRISPTSDGQDLMIGNKETGIKLTFLHTPGHTPGAQCIMISDNRLITGDTLFVNTCGRMDLPGGCPMTMFETLQNKLATLSDEIKIYPGHSYGNNFMSTIGRERKYGVLCPMTLEEWMRSTGGQAAAMRRRDCPQHEQTNDNNNGNNDSNNDSNANVDDKTSKK